MGVSTMCVLDSHHVCTCGCVVTKHAGPPAPAATLAEQTAYYACESVHSLLCRSVRTISSVMLTIVLPLIHNLCSIRCFAQALQRLPSESFAMTCQTAQLSASQSQICERKFVYCGSGFDYCSLISRTIAITCL